MLSLFLFKQYLNFFNVSHNNATLKVARLTNWLPLFSVSYETRTREEIISRQQKSHRGLASVNLTEITYIIT